jgi:P27 family predicted phage terminase small subunit
MRGRRPKPTARKRLEGNAGKRRLNTEEPQPPPLPPAPPEGELIPLELENQPIAIDEWRRLAPMLRQIRQITEADRGALIALCLEWARYITATRKVAELGLIVKTPNGYPIQNPYLAIATKALSGCNKLWPELGLTPSSRARVSRDDGPGASGDAFSEFDEAPPVRGLH